MSIPYATVRVAPMPTQIAYEVPAGNVRIEYASPAMLITRAVKNIMLGVSLVSPADLPRAVAHTASNIPEIIKIIHAMQTLLVSAPSCRVLVRPPSSGTRCHV